MKVSKQFESLYGSLIQIADVKKNGNSSWGEKEGYADNSVRLAWYTDDEKFDPISSAELPIWGLIKLLKASSESNLLSVEQSSEIIGYLNDAIYRKTKNNSIYLNCNINVHSNNDFIEYWSQRYSYKYEELYDKNINKPLTEASLIDLFTWKNGTLLSEKKRESVISNYVLSKNDDIIENDYLSPNNEGGPIWNIFFLHCRKNEQFPIFDQHTYRAMHFMKSNEIAEIPNEKKEIYSCYRQEYIPFFNSFEYDDKRQIDKALFTFGQYLKAIRNYV